MLERKRTALTAELLRLAEAVMARGEELERAATQASLALARADAFAGEQVVRLAALATKSEFALDINTANIMGVVVLRLQPARQAGLAPGGGYCPPAISILVAEAAQAFEAEVEAIISLADHELRLKRLAAEVERLSRRVNALDQLLVPRLEAEVNHIQMALDERERAARFQLKLVKRRLERRGI